MASVNIIPFNYDSGAFSIKTSSYPIPSGKYAFCYPKSPRCTINGSSIFNAITSSASVSSVPGVTRLLYPIARIRDLMQFDNVRATVTRSVGTKDCTLAVYIGDNITPQLTNNTFAYPANFSIFFMAATASSVAVSFSPSEIFSFIDTSPDLTAGTPPAMTQENVWLIAASTTTNSATEYSISWGLNKIPQQPYNLKAGDTLAGGEWHIIEYNSYT